MKKLRKKVKGFTLIEMVIVVAIIAMLTLLIIPNVVSQRNKAQKNSDTAFVQTIQTQVDLVEPKDEKNTFEALEKNNHITKDQYQKLVDGNYVIENGQVSKNKA